MARFQIVIPGWERETNSDSVAVNGQESHAYTSTIHLPSIEAIDLLGNYFNGSGIRNKNSSLGELNLEENLFSGNILPGLGNCSSLENLYLGANYLTCSAPKIIFGL
ncbi:LRR domain containing protein [Trema orientale]|uniref:LRR domain containing protein n=1 Tax=Trema orientale TaxID=63057 RepID=A0A2P5CIP0_TREOI|nr:LRR domain containing protein [Trema orientale]